MKRVIIIAPSPTRSGWNRARKRFHIPSESITFISYSDFQCDHKPFVTVTNNIGEQIEAWINDQPVQTPTITISVSENYLPFCNPDTLLIIDEIHLIKNDTLRTDCVKVLIKHLLEGGGKVLGLSATPYDKPVQAIRLMQSFEIMTQPLVRVVNPFQGIRDYAGLKQLHSFGKIKYYTGLERCTPDEISKYAFEEIISRSIKRRLYSNMTPFQQPFEVNAKNLFANADEESIEIIQNGAILLQKGITAFMLNQNAAEPPLSAITKGMMTIERGKVSVFARLAIQELEKRRKVILMMNYLNPIRKVAKLLENYRPLVLTGDTPESQRQSIIKAFQSKNWMHSLLICNTQLACMGIDLDDKVGTFPRSMLISPSYHLINLHQACGRVNRADTKSESWIRFVYVVTVNTETKLLHKLAEKSNTVKRAVTYQISFPGDYPQEVEQ